MPWLLHTLFIALAALLQFAITASAEVRAVVDKAAVKDCRCWAVQGQCQDNPRFMAAQCPASCTWHVERETSAQKVSDLTSRISECAAEVQQLQSDVASATVSQREAQNQSQALQVRIADLELQLASKNKSTDQDAGEACGVELHALRQQLEADLEAKRATELATTSLNQVEMQQLRDELHSLRVSELAAVDNSHQLEAEVAKLRSDASKEAAAVVAQGAANKRVVLERSVVQPNTSFSKQALVSGCTLWPRFVESTFSETAAGEHAELAAELREATAANQAMQKEISELRSAQAAGNLLHSDGVNSSSHREAELETAIKRMKQLVESATAAEVASTNASHILEARVLELESVLQSKMSTESPDGSNDTDPWTQLYEVLCDLPHVTRSFVNALPVAIGEFSRRVVGDIKNATRDSIPVIKDSVVAWIVAAQSSSKNMITGATEVVQEAQQALTGWLRKNGVWMLLCFSLLHFAGGLCVLLARCLLFVCSQRGVAPPSGQHVAALVERQQGDADSSGSPDPLVGSRLLRRELQELRTLQALKLVGVNPPVSVNECIGSAASAPQDDTMLSPKSPFRERRRPPPLVHLGFDSDVEVVKDIPLPQDKANAAVTSDMYTDGTLPRMSVCSTLAIFISLAACMTTVLLTLLAWFGYLPMPSVAELQSEGGKLQARLSGTASACSQYVTAMAVSLSQYVASVIAATSLEAIRVRDLVSDYAAGIALSLHSVAAEASIVIVQAAPMLRGRLPMLAVSLAVSTVVAVAVYCGCRRPAKKVAQSKQSSCKESEVNKLQDLSMQDQPEALKKQVEPATEDGLPGPSVKNQRAEIGNQMGTPVQGEHVVPCPHHPDSFTEKTPENMEKVSGYPAQTESVAASALVLDTASPQNEGMAKNCPVFDMSAEDEAEQEIPLLGDPSVAIAHQDPEEMSNAEPAASSPACFNTLFFTRLLCLGYIVTLAGIAFFHVFASQLDECRHLIASFVASGLSYMKASDAVLQATISVQKVKVAFGASLCRLSVTMALLALMIEAAGGAYLSQMSTLWDGLTSSARGAFSDVVAEPYSRLADAANSACHKVQALIAEAGGEAYLTQSSNRSLLFACSFVALALCLLSLLRFRTKRMVVKSPVSVEAVVMGLSVSQHMITAAPKQQTGGMFTGDSFMI